MCGLPIAEAVFFHLDEENPEIEATVSELEEFIDLLADGEAAAAK